MKKICMILISILIFATLLGCSTAKTNTMASSPPTQSTETRTFDVPMTGVHFEYFEFKAGDRIIVSFEVNGQYAIGIGVNGGSLETDDKGDIIKDTRTGTLVDINDKLNGNFNFIAPVTDKYTFAFSGYYADETDKNVWKPFAELSESMSLTVTINPD